MAVKTQAQLLAEVASLLADNTTGNISALDVRTCLNDIIDSASYGGTKVYEVLLTQTGTNAPTIVSNGTGANTPFVNTLNGTPVLSYSTVGRYLVTLAGEFIESKTRIYIGHNDITSLFSAYRHSDDVIRIECSDLSLVKANDLLVNFPIKIVVNP